MLGKLNEMSMSSGFPAGQRPDVYCKRSPVHLKDRPQSPTHGWLEVNAAARSPPEHLCANDRCEQRQRSPAHAYKCEGVNVRILTVLTYPHPPRQLLLKRVLYLSWQQWSHSPGLIYLKGRIMNSLWHLIFPSLLIWAFCRYMQGDPCSRASPVPMLTFQNLHIKKTVASNLPKKNANCT